MDDYAHSILNNGQTTVSNYLLRNYHRIGINNQELFIYLLIKGNHDLVIPMPEMGDLHAQTGYAEQQLFAVFHQMIEKKLTKITQVTIEGQQVDAYDFTPMYEKLALVKNSEATEELGTAVSPTVDSTKRQAVFQSIEKEFGRTLSPLEMESISQWLDIDHYSPELIQLALKEAVLSQVYNLKYMDRIISSWYKKNLKTPQQVEAYKKHRAAPHSSDNVSNGYNGPDIPFINLTGNSNK